MGGGVAGKRAIILIHQALLSGHEAFRASGSLVSGKKADNRKPFCGSKYYVGSDKRNTGHVPDRDCFGGTSATQKSQH
ncbi:hypothetical protein DMS68_24965 [Klebsiella variicola]|nr:hypothetical protein DMS46_05930 [Klebsiella variicola]PXL66801.1 hypothetical protein DMS68_24965 [Klebsiella variicola]